MKIKLKDESQTKLFGEILASHLKGGELITLIGDLGAGKTTLTKSLSKGLNISEDITSPTFTIVNEYDEGIGLNHFDVYRIYSSDEMFEIGFDEYLESGKVNIIEWADKIEDILPEDRIEIKLSYDGEGRILEINSIGEKYSSLVKDVYERFTEVIK